MDLTKLREQHLSRILSSNLVRAVQAGDVVREQYESYLSDVYSYALHSSQVIGLAGIRMALTHPELAHYLMQHAAEELGHDKWAASDLRDLGLLDRDISRIEPSSPCRRMLSLEYFYAAHDNPAGLLGWMFVLESLGGRIGGGIARALDSALQLNGKATYFLSGHGEADAHHSEDLFRNITAFIRAPADVRAFRAMGEETCDLYCAILDVALATRGFSAA